MLTLTKQTPGRIVYRTVDGSCTDPFTGQQQLTCSPAAGAPDDYGAVSGEVVFTGPGSERITIPIVDDDLVEGFEAFEVRAHEVEDTSGWGGAATAVVRITTTTTATSTLGAAPILTPPAARSPLADVPAAATTTASPSPGFEAALASGLQPGPGFELRSDGVAEPAAEPGRGGDGSGGSASWFAFGLGSTAVGAGGVVWFRRRSRWSPTRP